MQGAISEFYNGLEEGNKTSTEVAKMEDADGTQGGEMEVGTV